MKKNALSFVLLQIIGFIGLVAGFRLKAFLQPDVSFFTNVPTNTDIALIITKETLAILCITLIVSALVWLAGKRLKQSRTLICLSICITMLIPYLVTYIGRDTHIIFSYHSYAGAVIAVLVLLGFQSLVISLKARQ